MTKPCYTEQQLLRIIKDVPDIEDHERIITLYETLEKQGDITITGRIRNALYSAQPYFRFIHRLTTQQQLLDYYLKLVELHEKKKATITLGLKKRLEFQRDLIKNINQTK